MKSSKYYIVLLLGCIFLLFTGCDEWRSVSEFKKVEALNVNVRLNIEVDSIASLSELKITFDDYDNGYHYIKTFNDSAVNVDDITPGIYTVSVSGSGFDSNNTEYYLAGNQVNIALMESNKDLTITLRGLKVSPLIFKELYFCGSRPPVGTTYFRDQFFEIYNNSSQVQFLDGIYFSDLYPSPATTTLPVWPTEDGNNYVYGNRVWKFPGTGTDYPLQPGESAVVAQFAVNHQLEIYNPNSPVDCSHAEFEFNMSNTLWPDQPAIDMVHVFYNGKAEKGTLPQYLMTVFGPAYCMFKVPEGVTYDPVGDPTMHTRNLARTAATLYAKIPIAYVLDAVECIQNESMSTAKRVAAVLDAGMTWVGATYIGEGVTRKVSLDENGDTIRRANGALIFQDTNNSSDDFERNVIPVLHRYNTGVPSWNATY